MNSGAPRQNHTSTGRSYLNIVLTANAALLGVIALGGLHHGDGASLTPTASAQPALTRSPEPGDDSAGRISAAEQRKVMISELRALGIRLERIETTLGRGLSVKVTELPAGFVRERERPEAK